MEKEDPTSKEGSLPQEGRIKRPYAERGIPDGTTLAQALVGRERVCSLLIPDGLRQDLRRSMKGKQVVWGG
jgi:hypothetical protein